MIYELDTSLFRSFLVNNSPFILGHTATGSNPFFFFFCTKVQTFFVGLTYYIIRNVYIYICFKYLIRWKEKKIDIYMVRVYWTNKCSSMKTFFSRYYQFMFGFFKKINLMKKPQVVRDNYHLVSGLIH